MKNKKNKKSTPAKSSRQDSVKNTPQPKPDESIHAANPDKKENDTDLPHYPNELYEETLPPETHLH